jgi:hypothetical protein
MYITYLAVSLVLSFGFFWIQEPIEKKIKEALDKSLDF